MKYLPSLRSVILAFLVLFCAISIGQNKEQEFIVLEIYTLDSQEQEASIDQYLEFGLLPALKRQHLKSVGVLQHIPQMRDSLRQRFIIYPISALSKLNEINDRVLKDKTFQEENRNFLAAPHDSPPYQRKEVVLLKAFAEMPQLKPSKLEGDRNNRVYELRNYESPTEALFINKVHMFNEGGEVTLFDRLGFNAVFYGEVISGARMPNLMYLTTFKDMSTRDLLWKEFFTSPEWKELIENPFYNNNVNKVDIMFLSPTQYSDY